MHTGRNANIINNQIHRRKFFITAINQSKNLKNNPIHLFAFFNAFRVGTDNIYKMLQKLKEQLCRFLFQRW